MAEALRIAYDNLEEEKAYILSLKNYAKKGFEALFPNVHFNGSCGCSQSSTYTLLNVCLPIPAEKAGLLDFHLDLKGIACSKGSACQSGSTAGSHVLEEVVPKELKDRPSLRFSFSSFNTTEEIDYLMEVMASFNTA